MPQLDLAAQSTVRSTTITIAITGTPTAPKVAFTSSPSCRRTRCWSGLLFDRATGNLSPFEIAQLAAALAQLSGVGGGVEPARPGAECAGARPARGEQRPGQQRRLGRGRGRDVAPGVFLGVRQGTNGGQTGVGVQVEITPNIKLEGQTATGPAGDRVGLSV